MIVVVLDPGNAIANIIGKSDNIRCKRSKRVSSLVNLFEPDPLDICTLILLCLQNFIGLSTALLRFLEILSSFIRLKGIFLVFRNLLHEDLVPGILRCVRGHNLPDRILVHSEFLRYRPDGRLDIILILIDRVAVEHNIVSSLAPRHDNPVRVHNLTASCRNGSGAVGLLGKNLLGILVSL